MARSSSPDSSLSISSLLASCSLSSSSSSSRSLGSIEYKNKLYDSATKALEAYIEDYDRSLQSSVTSTGKITIRTSSNHSIRKTDSGMKLKPSFSRRRPFSRDSDLLSLTTDDLLGFPSDGSLPWSQACLSEQKHLRNHNKQSRSSLKRHIPVSSQSALLYRRNFVDHGDFSDTSHKARRKMDYVPYASDRVNKLYSQDASPYLLKESSLAKSYPRWLTSHKSELSVSGITSVPDVKYPLWLKNHDLYDSEGQSTCDVVKSSEFSSFPKNSKKKLHSTDFLGHLDNLHLQLKDVYVHSEGFNKVHTDLSLDQNANKQCDLDMKDMITPLKNDPVDLLLQKSEPVDSPQNELSSPLRDHGSPQTEDVLESDRSWEKIPFPLKSPVPVLCEDGNSRIHSFKSNTVQDLINGCLQKDPQIPASTFSGGNHHGPVEALKHMLFNLQTFQQTFNQSKTTEQVEELQKVRKEADSELKNLEQEMFPVNKSLQKALHHLSRLKELVGDGSIKHGQEKNKEL